MPLATSCSLIVPPRSAIFERASSRALDETSPERTRSPPASAATRIGGSYVGRGREMSTQRRIYLDFNATAPLSDAACAAMTAAMAEVGNPSSVHAEGRRARDRVEQARAQVAALVGRPAE